MATDQCIIGDISLFKLKFLQFRKQQAKQEQKKDQLLLDGYIRSQLSETSLLETLLKKWPTALSGLIGEYYQFEPVFFPVTGCSAEYNADANEAKNLTRDLDSSHWWTTHAGPSYTTNQWVTMETPSNRDELVFGLQIWAANERACPDVFDVQISLDGNHPWCDVMSGVEYIKGTKPDLEDAWFFDKLDRLGQLVLFDFPVYARYFRIFIRRNRGETYTAVNRIRFYMRKVGAIMDDDKNEGAPLRHS